MDSNVILKDLTKLSEQIESSKKEQSVLEGRKIEAMKRLSELGFSNIAEAEKWLLSEDKVLNKMEKQIQEKYDGLKGKYKW